MIIASRQVLDGMNRFAFLAVLMLFVSPAFPWGCAGHRTVALIALDQLSSNARTMTARLLQGEPSDPSLRHFCGPSGLDPFADVSTWADDIRGRRKETGPWHFIDIPLGATRDHLNDDCADATGCVTSAIRREMEVLRSESASGQEKTEALIFMIHFVGDLHQPLHAATNNDRGGNCMPVALFDHAPERQGAGDNYRPNLHGVWDTDLLERIAGGRGPVDFAPALSRRFGADISRWKRQQLNLDDWAWESHRLAIRTVYGKLPQRVPLQTPKAIESCADDGIGSRMYELHERIDQRYLRAASPVIQRQLARAGTRLAMLLNQIWR
jgi:hypothetical protein